MAEIVDFSVFSPLAESALPSPDKTDDTPERAYSLDNLEKEIIRRLNEDGRKPFQTIAKEVGVDEKTVRNRVSRLRERGLLRVLPSVSGNRLRDCLTEIVGVTITQEYRARMREVAGNIAALPAVSWVGIVMGRYDLLVEVVVRSRAALTQFQLSELTAVAGVGTAEGFLVLSHHGMRGVPFTDAVLSSDR
ncbi:MAG TPA: Lrp/AsnC family transcriptional regulator [Oligoflexia bacterium]|nr:Lrp/AsnC family transcriptional regulator [Oligoflexia bacterium]